MKFFKNGYDGGIGNFLLEMGGSQEWGFGSIMGVQTPLFYKIPRYCLPPPPPPRWFYNGRDGKSLKSLYIVGRGVLTPLFYEDLPILPIAPF